MSNGDAMIGASVDLSKFRTIGCRVICETQSRIVLSCLAKHAEKILRAACR